MLFPYFALLLQITTPNPARPAPRSAALRWETGALPAGGVSVIAADPRTPSRVYAGGTGIFRSDDFGASWQALDRTLRPDFLAIDPSDPMRVYAVSGGSLWMSSDTGATWSEAVAPTPDVFSLLIDWTGTLYARTSNGSVRSDDLGAHWSAVPGLPTGEPVYVLAADPFTPGRVYGVVGFLPSASSELFWSLNRGNSWNGPILSTGFGTGIGAVASPQSGSTLYVATSFNVRITSGFVSASTDGGITWTALFSADNVFALAAEASGSTAYVATPRGVYAVGVGRRTTFLGGPITGAIAISADGSSLYAIDANRDLWVASVGPTAGPHTRIVPTR